MLLTTDSTTAEALHRLNPDPIHHLGIYQMSDVSDNNTSEMSSTEAPAAATDAWWSLRIQGLETDAHLEDEQASQVRFHRALWRCGVWLAGTLARRRPASGRVMGLEF